MPRAKALNRAGVTAEPLTCTSRRDRRENLGRGLEAHELDVEPLVFEVTLLLSDEDAGIGHRADGADLDCHARIERRGLRRGGRAGDRQRGQEEAHAERRSNGPKRHDGSPLAPCSCKPGKLDLALSLRSSHAVAPATAGW